MGGAKRLAVQKMLGRKPRAESNAISTTIAKEHKLATPAESPSKIVQLKKCDRCGGRDFRIRFEIGNVRYTILADCVECGCSRRASLDEAFKANNKKVRREEQRDGRSGASDSKAAQPTVSAAHNHPTGPMVPERLSPARRHRPAGQTKSAIGPTLTMRCCPPADVSPSVSNVHR